MMVDLDDDAELAATIGRFEEAADRWAITVAERALLLGSGSADVSALLDGRPIRLDREVEHRVRLIVEIDRSLASGFVDGFALLVWLRLDGSPSRLRRMFAGLPAMRVVRREAEECAR